ncbi:MAG: oxidoreductase [Bacteroidetes bacterium GWF2_49_14]|nr:MAG: oxidoreductase [Bacteroidetes bacterium GWF2_49_14]HBB92473.1 oxidoreductase [Bacteroidales bacterium]
MSTRRDFVKTSATAAAAVAAVSAVPGAISCANQANNKLVIGVIGINGMGFSDVKAFLKQENVECAAICDIDQTVLNKRTGNIEELQGKKPEVFNDYRKLLERKDIDAVIIGTPDHWHARIMVDACDAGKHVYVEKPMANTIYEAFQMEKAGRRYKKVVQVGQWQRSDPHWNDAFAFVQSGKLGKVRTVKVWCYESWLMPPGPVPDENVPDGVNYDMWLGPAQNRPFNRNRFHFNFRWFWDYAGGLMTDWGVHLLDMALAGMQAELPKSAMSSGGKLAFPESPIETPDTQQVIYEYDGFNVIWDHAMGIGNGDWRRDHGVAFIGNNGTLIADRGGWEVVPEQGKDGPLVQEVVRIPGTGQGLTLHVQNFIECIKKNERETNANPTIGRAVASMAHMGNIAFKTGQKIYWDPENENFKNNPEASRLITPVYRDPWKLPNV